MGQYKMTLTSFNHYKRETIKVVQIRSLLSMYMLFISSGTTNGFFPFFHFIK